MSKSDSSGSDHRGQKGTAEWLGDQVSKLCAASECLEAELPTGTRRAKSSTSAQAGKGDLLSPHQSPERAVDLKGQRAYVQQTQEVYLRVETHNSMDAKVYSRILLPRRKQASFIKSQQGCDFQIEASVVGFATSFAYAALLVLSILKAKYSKTVRAIFTSSSPLCSLQAATARLCSAIYASTGLCLITTAHMHCC